MQKGISRAHLETMIEQATVDAYGDSEQRVGFYTMIDEHLALPFTTRVLGADVIVVAIDQNESQEIIAICTRGRSRQAVPILDLPLPSPAPAGVEWIEAYRHWARGGT